MRFVPEENRKEDVPCWFIPLSTQGDTVDYHSRCGSQLELEDALGKWLREAIQKSESDPGTLPADDGEISTQNTLPKVTAL